MASKGYRYDAGYGSGKVHTSVLVQQVGITEVCVQPGEATGNASDRSRERSRKTMVVIRVPLPGGDGKGEEGAIRVVVERRTKVPFELLWLMRSVL